MFATSTKHYRGIALALLALLITACALPASADRPAGEGERQTISTREPPSACPRIAVTFF